MCLRVKLEVGTEKGKKVKKYNRWYNSTNFKIQKVVFIKNAVVQAGWMSMYRKTVLFICYVKILFLKETNLVWMNVSFHSLRSSMEFPLDKSCCTREVKERIHGTKETTITHTHVEGTNEW